MSELHFAGIDIGSTTAKVVIFDKHDRLVFSRYRRHQAKTIETLQHIFTEAFAELGDMRLDLAVTGSAGIGAAETFNLPFVQEVVASAQVIKRSFPQARTFIEIGGEDSKIIFFDDQLRPDIRMNGTCAGGTGAFIDQMAVLLDMDVAHMNLLAQQSTTTYPIASRCGVFAKTDIQALLSRNVPKEDVAASIFRAVAVQVVAALSRGRAIEKKIVLAGGPLTFCSGLRRAFAELLAADHPQDMIIPEHPELLPAMGAAMVRTDKPCCSTISQLLSLADNSQRSTRGSANSLAPMFDSSADFNVWQKRHAQQRVARIDLREAGDRDLFLGIDSGSTTTKIVLTDAAGTLLYSYYHANNGDPIQAAKAGLIEIKDQFAAIGVQPRIVRSAATGYGESLVRAAFGLHDGAVETMAHYRAACHFEPEVSFILDIGGQDMKAIYIQDHAVSEIQVNEACSSGCGSFIETFARSLGYGVAEFADIACANNAPFDLGTRCTVFMNSKVKQALREGASISDISAGLAYSVIKNALYKVLKLKDFAALGDKIVVQGGTFRNNAVLRALELLLGREVVRPDISELMGAYGAALTAMANQRRARKTGAAGPQINKLSIATLAADSSFSHKQLRCKRCENNCEVLQLCFDNGNRFYTGNRCERYFSNSQDEKQAGNNLFDAQLKLLFERNTEPAGEAKLTYGIPRCLNMYENYPFWCTFLTRCGFRVVLSAPSTFQLYEKGFSSVMSENICFPAKLAHGHLFDLCEKKVERIFFPTVVYEQEEYDDALDSFNCPVITGYPDLLKSAVDPKHKFGIPLDNPAVSFKNFERLQDQLFLFFKKFGINYRTVAEAVAQGRTAQEEYKQKLRALAQQQLAAATNAGRTTVVLAGRPYHADPLINHGIPTLLTQLGVDVISETALPLTDDAMALEGSNVLTQWGYSNRLYAAAGWVTKTAAAQLVQLTSFGCGPDAISTDEVKEILASGGKVHTLLKMDEIANLGAANIRLRSMLDALRENSGKSGDAKNDAGKTTSPVRENSSDKTLIVPYFSPFYSPLVPSAFKPLGYKVKVLPPQDKGSSEWGLKTINNDMCYPAVLIAGDIIKAFQEGGHDPEKTAVVLTQTGGQCRASSYVALIRKGLTAAGLDNVPVITISDEEITPDGGFEINRKGLMKRLALGVVFADPLARMYLSTCAREKVAGSAKKLHGKYLAQMEYGIEHADYPYLLNLLNKAVTDFNAIEVTDNATPRVGIVGEIFVKYNFFSNGNLIDWLSAQGVEVVLPPIRSFFAQRFINETYMQQAFFKRSIVDRTKYKLLEIYSKYHLARIERVMQGFHFHTKSHDLRELAAVTGEVVSLANQYGEGWLLTAEMIAMLKDGTHNIICLQPFGCIANHITGRGVENKLRELFPALNLLSLDMDAGASEVNILNRLHILLSEAQEETVRTKDPLPGRKVQRRSILQNALPRELQAFNSYTTLEVEKWRAWMSRLELLERARTMRRKIGL